MRIRRLGATVAVAAALLAGACGGDDDDDDAAPASTTTSAASDATSTTASEGDEEEAGGGSTSRGEREVPPSVTAPLPSQGQPLADGAHAVYLEEVDLDGRTVKVDVIQFLTGDEADEAYEAETGDDGGVPNDYFIKNASQDQRTVEVADDVEVTVAMTGDEVRQSEVRFDELPAYLGRSDVNDMNDAFVFWMTVEDGVVVALDEQYRP